jgi:hypothetical protein
MSSTKSSAASGGRLFLVAIVLAAIGGAAFFVGLGAAFRRAGNWSNNLAGIGILLLIVGGVINLVAAFMGARFMYASRTLLWWWLLSATLAAASIAGGLVALNL